MAGSAQKAKDLLEIAVATYTEELAPALAKDKRYVGAMVASALGAARRRLGQPDPAEALLQTLGSSDMKTLAKSIRSGDVSDQSHNGLGEALLAYVEAELAITNPKFLEWRTD